MSVLASKTNVRTRSTSRSAERLDVHVHGSSGQKIQKECARSSGSQVAGGAQHILRRIVNINGNTRGWTRSNSTGFASRITRSCLLPRTACVPSVCLRINIVASPSIIVTRRTRFVVYCAEGATSHSASLRTIRKSLPARLCTSGTNSYDWPVRGRAARGAPATLDTRRV